MTTVSISELKANLSRYLREVRRGGEIEVLDRGVPVARLVPLDNDGGEDAELIAKLVKNGLLSPGRGDARAILDEPPPDLPCSVLEALREERAEGR